MPKKYDYGRESAALLASSIVFLLGFVGVMFILVTSVDDPLWPSLLAASVFVGLFGMLLMGLKSNNGSGNLGLWFKAKKPDPPADYSPRRVRTSTDDSTCNNGPPTVEGVRDIKESKESNPNTWVPSSVPKQNR